MFFRVRFSCRILYSIVSYLYLSCSGSITSVWEEEKANFLLSFTAVLVIMWFLFGEVSFSSWFLRWAALFYCGTP